MPGPAAGAALAFLSSRSPHGRGKLRLLRDSLIEANQIWGAGWPWRSGSQGDLWGLIKGASRWAHHPQGREGDSSPVESEGLFQGMALRERTLLE